MSENINDSVNELVGTFATVNTGGKELIPNKLIAIDTSNNRLGINTIDPSYELHIVNGLLSTPHIDISGNLTGVIDLSNNIISVNDLSIVRFIIPSYNDSLMEGQIYKDNGGFLKIK
tara:strand:+ start:115 stop:465 length:351 start_codon:yes stop_codon:yes gene_type:complete